MDSTLIIVLVGAAVVLLLAATIFFLRRRRPDELKTAYEWYGNDEDGHTHSVVEWEQMAEASLKASRARRGLTGSDAR